MAREAGQTAVMGARGRPSQAGVNADIFDIVEGAANPDRELLPGIDVTFLAE